LSVDVRPLRAEDAPALRALLEATGVFSSVEVDAAMQDVEGGSDDEAPHGYRFLVAVDGAAPLGFTCFGRAWFSDGTWDLYWIAVDPASQRAGVGGALLAAVEAAAAAEGGRTMLAETGSKTSYEPARRFYRRHGYTEIARIPDFYAVGDDKVFYAKPL
jgi:ribosomal protein S18 acetylase RimI-like enzyme